VKDAADLDAVRRFVAACRPAAVLIDSFVPGEMGGTGHRAPWHLLAGFAPGVPVILAGGLTPDNAADAIRLVRPWGVDVASGVDSSPGKKDPGRVRAFVQAARSVTP
jgi:phosphoribosylanthranilate isomerase